MSRIHAEAERVIDARPEEVYKFLANYRESRPRILPPNFQYYNVEEGGRGAGTIVSYRLQAGNRERAYRMQVEEPSQGRVLLERDLGSTLVNTWTVSPITGGQTLVAVTTEWESRASGVGSFFERTFAPMGLRRIYVDMLNRLAEALGASAAASR
jgi:hypothetical protein